MTEARTAEQVQHYNEFIYGIVDDACPACEAEWYKVQANNYLGFNKELKHGEDCDYLKWRNEVIAEEDREVEGNTEVWAIDMPDFGTMHP